MAATALDALFDVNPSVATELAEERLGQSLAINCVPADLVTLLARKRLDPYRTVERRLGELDCDRRKLLPAHALFETRSSGGRQADDPSLEARANAERMSPGKCRAAFESLFGLDEKSGLPSR